MPEDKKPKQKKPISPKASPEDLEKTVLDINLRDLDLELEKTVLVKAPQEEDSDLHDRDFFEEEERTGGHDISKLVEEPKVKIQVPPSYTPSPIEKSYTPISKAPFSPFFVGCALLLFLLLVEGLIEVLHQGGALRLPSTVAVIFAGISLVGILLRRWEAKKGFLWINVAWFGLVAYAGFNFFTSDPESLHFLKIPLNSWLGPILCFVGGVMALGLYSEKGLGFFIKTLALAAWFLILLAYGFSLLNGQSLEDGLWGPTFLKTAPWYLRPTPFALSFSFLFFALAALFDLGSGRSFQRGLWRSVGLPLLIISVFGTLLGARLLMRQGIQVPWGKVIAQDYFGATVLDSTGDTLRLQLMKGKQSFGVDKDLHLEMAASHSVEQGSARKAWLMVKNMEGRTFAASLDKNLILSRGDKQISGLQATLELSRLGAERNLALLIDMPSLREPQIKMLLASSIHRLASELGGNGRLFLISQSGIQTLLPSEKQQWQSQVDKALVMDLVSFKDLFSSALKTFSSLAGIQQIIFVSDSTNLIPSDERENFLTEARKNKIAVSFMALGKPGALEEQVYFAQVPSALGFEMLSAAAESLGDFSLKFPHVASLPKLELSRDSSGQVVIQEGKLDFNILVKDPSQIRALNLKIDDDQPIDLDFTQLRQSVDLVRLKIQPGLRRFTLTLTTQAGDVIREAFEVNYVTHQALKFVKPLEHDSISGTFNVMFAVGHIPGLETKSLTLLADGSLVGEATTDPFLISLDTTTLSGGNHVLQASQVYSDGSIETSQIEVNVDQITPSIKIIRPSIGEYLSNLADIEAEVGGGLFQQVEKVEFLVDGKWVGESFQSPFRFLWANTSYPAGKYFIQARAYLASKATTTAAVPVQLGQGEIMVRVDSSLSAMGAFFPENIEVLLDASLSMNEPLGASIKFDLSKYALAELSQILPDGVRLETRVYGGQSNVAQSNCTDSLLLKNISHSLDAFQPKGTSSLTYALKNLEKDLKNSTGSRVALLITDGWDKCGEDPIQVAETFVKTNEKTRLHIIYFSDVDAATESLLKKLAEVTGGRVYKVSSEEEVKEALQDAIQVSFALYDYKNMLIADQPLSPSPFIVRSGEYRLEIDTSPPIVKDHVVISTGTRKTFTVLYGEGKYELREDE